MSAVRSTLGIGCATANTSCSAMKTRCGITHPLKTRAALTFRKSGPSGTPNSRPTANMLLIPRTRVAGARCASPRFPMRPAGGRSPTTVAKNRVGVLTARNCTFLLPKAVARCQRKSRFLTPQLKQKTPRPGSRPRSFPLEIVRQSWSLRPTTDHRCRHDPLALTPRRVPLRTKPSNGSGARMEMNL
jgi:hypothetical protein